MKTFDKFTFPWIRFGWEGHQVLVEGAISRLLAFFFRRRLFDLRGGWFIMGVCFSFLDSGMTCGTECERTGHNEGSSEYEGSKFSARQQCVVLFRMEGVFKLIAKVSHSPSGAAHKKTG